MRHARATPSIPSPPRSSLRPDLPSYTRRSPPHPILRKQAPPNRPLLCRHTLTPQITASPPSTRSVSHLYAAWLARHITRCLRGSKSLLPQPIDASSSPPYSHLTLNQITSYRSIWVSLTSNASHFACMRRDYKSELTLLFLSMHSSYQGMLRSHQKEEER